MKKLLLLAMCLASGLVAWAQGTVNFANGAAGVNAPIREYPGEGNVLLSGSAYKADLWYGPAGISPGDRFNSGLQSLGLAVNFATGASAGYFFGGPQPIPGFGAGSVVSLQVRAWRAADGPDWLAATFTRCAHAGESDVIQVTLGGGAIPVPNMIGLTSFNLLGPNPFDPVCVPEPSSVALGLLAAAGLLLSCHRR